VGSLKRGDADDFREMGLGPLFEQSAGDKIAGATGPFAKSLVTPEGIERVVAEIIWAHQGRGNPISIAMLSKCTGKSDREIKGIVEQLVVTHKMPIGGKRSEPVGYFVIQDAEDLETAVRPYREQIFAMWRRLRVLLEPRALRELYGQLAIGESGEAAARALVEFEEK